MSMTNCFADWAFWSLTNLVLHNKRSWKKNNNNRRLAIKSLFVTKKTAKRADGTCNTVYWTVRIISDRRRWKFWNIRGNKWQIHCGKFLTFFYVLTLDWGFLVITVSTKVSSHNSILFLLHIYNQPAIFVKIHSLRTYFLTFLLSDRCFFRC